MATQLDQARDVLARANRIIANEGVLDAFGHVSMRHPTDPGRYLLSRSRAPELVQPDDILEFTLDSQPVNPTDVRFYGERVIHGGIYQARPDVNAVCHHHAPSILPFCISGMDLRPVYHLGATLGEKVPFWDARDDFGDTTLIVGEAGRRCVADARTGRKLDRPDAPARCNRRRHQPRRAHVSHDLHRAQRGASNSGAHARTCVAAQPDRDAPCRRIQSASWSGHARMGILECAAG